MKPLLIAAGIALFACTARASNAPADEGFGSLTVEQVADLLAKHQADVFDNNGKDEYAKGHVPGAKWVAFNDVRSEDLPKDKTRTLVFYCHNEH